MLKRGSASSMFVSLGVEMTLNNIALDNTIRQHEMMYNHVKLHAAIKELDDALKQQNGPSPGNVVISKQVGTKSSGIVAVQARQLSCGLAMLEPTATSTCLAIPQNTTIQNSNSSPTSESSTALALECLQNPVPFSNRTARPAPPEAQTKRCCSWKRCWFALRFRSWWLLCAFINVVFPKLVMCGLGLVVEKSLTGSYAAMARVTVAAHGEIEQRANKLMTYVEESLDITFFDEHPFDPRANPVSAQQSKAIAAAVGRSLASQTSTGERSLSQTHLDDMVHAAAAAGAAAAGISAPDNSADAATPAASRWNLPGWVCVTISGCLINLSRRV